VKYLLAQQIMVIVFTIFGKIILKFYSPKNPNSIASTMSLLYCRTENKVWMSFIGLGLDV
jgi:hypothetical protein